MVIVVVDCQGSHDERVKEGISQEEGSLRMEQLEEDVKDNNYAT